MNRIFYLPTVETVGYLKHVCLSWVLIRRLGSWSWFVVLVRGLGSWSWFVSNPITKKILSKLMNRMF